MPKPSRPSTRDKDGPARSHIVSLIGSNSFTLHKYLEEITARFLKTNSKLALERIDGEETNSRDLIEAVQGGSLFSKAKLVVVRDLSLNKAAQSDIEQIISSVDENTDLILVDPNIDRRSAYFTVLKDKSELHDFKGLEPLELVKWLVNEAKKQSANLSLSDANHLVERTGANQRLLATELDKLVTYSPDISRQTIDELVVENPQSKVFDLLDAVFGGRKQVALKLYSEQRAQMVEPQEIVAMIAWQLRLIVLAKVTDKTPDQIATDTSSSAYPIKKAAGLGRNLSKEELKSLINGLYEIDYLAKTKSIDLDEALKTYLVTI